jgi:hypothetical protein
MCHPRVFVAESLDVGARFPLPHSFHCRLLPTHSARRLRPSYPYPDKQTRTRAKNPPHSSPASFTARHEGFKHCHLRPRLGHAATLLCFHHWLGTLNTRDPALRTEQLHPLFQTSLSLRGHHCYYCHCEITVTVRLPFLAVAFATHCAPPSASIRATLSRPPPDPQVPLQELAQSSSWRAPPIGEPPLEDFSIASLEARKRRMQTRTARSLGSALTATTIPPPRPVAALRSKRMT